MINECFKIKNQCLNHLVKITINNSCSSFVNLSAGLFKTAAHQPALILSSVKFGNYARRSPSMAFNCLAGVEPSSTATKCWCACFECVCVVVFGGAVSREWPFRGGEHIPRRSVLFRTPVFSSIHSHPSPHPFVKLKKISLTWINWN